MIYTLQSIYVATAVAILRALVVVQAIVSAGIALAVIAGLVKLLVF